ncbi:putative metallophosphoesterase [Deinococcus aetherius]|uniref:Metallophosphoesterase n=1 Tax=Deinococcus aetherius TaxID=200252 RepID=A0ABN6RGB6_9DEIO|nr:metallophosphoesterase [Deinococcus aetherius]BDP42395.1 putative metallophosphoesterase [Deinococcus aetherius]
MRRAAWTVGLGLSALTGVALAQAYTFEVNHHRHELPGLRSPLRVVQLSDLHYGPYMGRGSVRGWVDAALALRPDVVLVTGDFVDRRGTSSLEPLFEELARLRAPLGVWGVWGNHDLAYLRRAAHREGRSTEAAREAFAGKLRRAGIRILRNEGAPLREDVFLAGVDDLRRGEVRLEAALSQAPAGGAVLLMSHTPDLLPEVPGRVGLSLCGHTHGGQVCLPLVGPLVTSSRFGRRFASGFVQGPAPGFVSRGLGVTTLPFRLNCPPEVVVFDFVPG